MSVELTKAQMAFLQGIKPHLGYRVIARFSQSARSLELLGLVTLSNGRLFAHITDAGRAALSPTGEA